MKLAHCKGLDVHCPCLAMSPRMQSNDDVHEQDILTPKGDTIAPAPGEAPALGPQVAASALLSRRRLQEHSLPFVVPCAQSGAQSPKGHLRKLLVDTRVEHPDPELAVVVPERRLQQREDGRRRVAAPLPPRAPPVTSLDDLNSLPQNNLAKAARRTSTHLTAAEFNMDRTHGPSPIGAAGTYNHLTDAILDVPRTRAMYLRRLRTLMEKFMRGRIEEILADVFIEARSAAALDNAHWGNGDIERGYKCAHTLSCCGLQNIQGWHMHCLWHCLEHEKLHSIVDILRLLMSVGYNQFLTQSHEARGCRAACHKFDAAVKDVLFTSSTK
jgi:hypothetical protein